MTTKRVLVFATGGPGAFVTSKGGIAPKRQSTEKVAKTISEFYPTVSSMTELDVVYWDTIDSSQMIPSLWSQIASGIAEAFSPDKHDGILVLHGSDTTAYTSAALSFVLGNLTVPVVMTMDMGTVGTHSSAANNVIDALNVAAKADLAEVCVVSNHRIIRGTRARKARMGLPSTTTEFEDVALDGRYFKVRNPLHQFNAFESVNASDLGLVEFEHPKMNAIEMRRRPPSRNRLSSSPEMEQKVALLKYYPGFDPSVIDYYVDKGFKGLVLESLGDAGLRTEPPFSVVQSIRDAYESGVVVIICSQVFSGSVAGQFESFRKSIGDYCVLGYDMLPEVAYVKLMWVLARENTHKRVSHSMLTPISYEITPEFVDLDK